MKFDKQADKELIANLRHRADLPAYAERLGMKLDKDASYKGHQVFRNGSEKIDTYRAPDGTWRWHERHSRENGDIFALHSRITGESFAKAKEAVAEFEGSARNMTPTQLNESTQQAKADQVAESIDRQAEIEAGTQKARHVLGLMGRRDTRYLEERGISREVLAETRWKTNLHGSAVFPHYDADRNLCGYEYRGYDYQDKETGETKQAKGFSRDTEKGIYIANGRCPNPTEIRFCEGGVDTLSAYQLATPAERQRILFVGTTGETGPNTEAAIKALAERNNIQKFSLAYDRDEGGEGHTAKREERLRKAFPDAQIRDVREELGMREKEDPNDLLRRLQAERNQSAERTQDRTEANRTQDAQPTPARVADQSKPAAEHQAKPEPKPEPAQQAEPEQTHDQYQDRGMSR